MRTLFYNGNILTLEDEVPQQAMLVENDTIRAVGKNEELETAAPDAEKVDLKGATVLPGFIDAHSHLSSYANTLLQASLTQADSFQSVVELLRAFAKDNALKPGQWLIGNGYDHNKLREKEHPTKQLLDEAFPDNPVVLLHQSGHFGVFNTAGLEIAELTGKDRDGYLEETVFVDAVKKLPMPVPEQLMSAYKQALAHYASFGITTIQEGLMVEQMLPLYQMLLAQNALTLDVVGYPQLDDEKLFYDAFPDSAAGYVNGFRLGGYKIILDGSPQGRTAWMKTPYVGSDDCFGVSSMTDEQVLAALRKAVADGRQLLAHCNGDAAVEQLLSAAEKIADKQALAAIRPVIIHAQLLETAQLPRVKELGFLPSFFVAHCYYWGDVHIQNFGMARAETISPAKSALEQGIRFTFHQDTPVLEPDMLRTVWCAVNRKTKDGVLLGEAERISALDALKAVTINAAYQYGEEASKGTLAPGKKADFVVLEQDPLQVPSEEIADIPILQTYKSGKCIYKKI